MGPVSVTALNICDFRGPQGHLLKIDHRSVGVELTQILVQESPKMAQNESEEVQNDWNSMEQRWNVLMWEATANIWNGHGCTPDFGSGRV